MVPDSSISLINWERGPAKKRGWEGKAAGAFFCLAFLDTFWAMQKVSKVMRYCQVLIISKIK